MVTPLTINQIGTIPDASVVISDNVVQNPDGSSTHTTTVISSTFCIRETFDGFPEESITSGNFADINAAKRAIILNNHPHFGDSAEVVRHDITEVTTVVAHRV